MFQHLCKAFTENSYFVTVFAKKQYRNKKAIKKAQNVLPTDVVFCFDGNRCFVLKRKIDMRSLTPGGDALAAAETDSAGIMATTGEGNPSD